MEFRISNTETEWRRWKKSICLHLLQRLGKANTKRRQLLKYNEKHHEKIVGRRRSEDTRNRNDGDSNDGDEVGDQGAERGSVEVQDMIGFDEGDYISGKASMTMQTTVSALHEENYEPGSFENDQLDEDSRSETGYSQTSYATSSAGSTSSSNKLCVPPPPNGYTDEPFACPYCFRIVTDGGNTIAWQCVFQTTVSI